MNKRDFTPEQQKDIQQRSEAFFKDYQGIVEKHQIDFISVPQMVPDENGVFGLMIQNIMSDKKYASVKSPLSKLFGK
jgi:hypothetical protein